MADDFALGNALMTFGQAAGNTVNGFFKDQINAAIHAQSNGLEQMKFKADQEDKAAQRSETIRQHDLENKSRQDTLDETKARDQANQSDKEATLAQTKAHEGVMEGQGAERVAIAKTNSETAKIDAGIRQGILENTLRNGTNSQGAVDLKTLETDQKADQALEKDTSAQLSAITKAYGGSTDKALYPPDQYKKIQELQGQLEDIRSRLSNTNAQIHATTQASRNAANSGVAPKNNPNVPPSVKPKVTSQAFPKITPAMEGYKLTGPDGKTYIVKNGVPEPVNG